MSEALVIRLWRQDDLLALRTLFNAVVASGTAFLAEEPLSEAAFAARVAAATAVSVAELNGEVVGGYFLRSNHGGRGQHVANAAYFVSAQHGGQGIGYQLGKHSLQLARQHGFAAMQFNAVVATNVRAVALWERLGFAIFGTMPQAFRHAKLGLVDVHVMHRFL